MNINSSLTALQNDTDYNDADYFQYRVETFFSEVLLTNAKPTLSVSNLRCERVPTYMPLYSELTTPKLTCDNKQAYIDYIDKHVQAYLPSKEEDAELHDLVKMYQKHSQFQYDFINHCSPDKHHQNQLSYALQCCSSNA